MNLFVVGQKREMALDAWDFVLRFAIDKPNPFRSMGRVKTFQSSKYSVGNGIASVLLT